MIREYYSFVRGCRKPTFIMSAENAREAFEKFLDHGNGMSFDTGFSLSADYITYFESQDECAGLIDYISRSDPSEDYTEIVLIKRKGDYSAYE